MPYAIAVFVAAILVVIGIVFYKTIVTGEWRNVVPGESEHWQGVFFYHNADDPRYFLPKRTGLGWTINFAHAGAIVMIVAIMAAVGAFSFILSGVV